MLKDRGGYTRLSFGLLEHLFPADAVRLVTVDGMRQEATIRRIWKEVRSWSSSAFREDKRKNPVVYHHYITISLSHNSEFD